MRVMGIDPGVTGAVAIVGDDCDPVVADLVAFKVTNGKKVRSSLSPALCAELMADLGAGVAHVWIERVSALHVSSRIANFSLGHSLGILQTIVYGMGLPLTTVPSARWKRELRVTKDKNACRARAAELFPGVADELARVKDHNRAEALLIALYGLRTDSHIPLVSNHD